MGSGGNIFKNGEVSAMPKGWEVVRLGDYAKMIMVQKYKKPQMNADERRYVHAAGFGKKTHRKVRKERKAAQQESLCPLYSPWLNASSAPAHERAPPALHPRRAEG